VDTNAALEGPLFHGGVGSITERRFFQKADEIEGGKIAIGNRRGVAIEKENRIVILNDNPVVD
jgi:hypothetical protein